MNVRVPERRAKLRLVKCEPMPQPRLAVWITARDCRVPFGRTRLTERGLHELVAAATRIEGAGR
jgi:hypothetical protein